MKVAITLTPKEDGSILYSAETDEPADNHPLLDEMRRDLLALRGVKSRSTDVIALITGAVGDRIVLAVSVECSVDPKNLLEILNLRADTRKSLDKLVTGQEILATIAVDNGLVVRDLKPIPPDGERV